MITFFVSVVFGLVLFHLYNRLAVLEQQVEDLKRTGSPAVSDVSRELEAVESPTSFTERLSNTIPEPPRVTSPNTIPEPSSAAGDFFDWLSQDFLMKIGALLLLIAAGWFVSYAFANNWIGPTGRIFLGLVLGISFLGAGVWRIQSFVQQGAIFVVVGSTTILLTVFAARTLYDFFTPATALLIMTASIVFSAFVAVQYRLDWLAALSVFSGAVAPLLLATTEPNILLLLSYVLALVLGSLWVMSFLNHSGLLVLAFLASVFYTLPYIDMSASAADAPLTFIFSAVFALVFLIATCISLVLRTEYGGSYGAQIFVAGANAFLIIAWILSRIEETWQPFAFLGWAVVFSVVAFVTYLYTRNHIPFYVHGAVALVLVAAATAAAFSGPVLTIALTLEVGFVVGAALILLGNRLLAERLCLLFFVPSMLALESLLSSAWSEAIFHADFVVVVVLIATLAAIGILLTQPNERDDRMVAFAAPALLLLAGGFTMALVWNIYHVMLSEVSAVFASLLTYTICGLVLYVSGVARQDNVSWIAGLFLIGFVLVRLLFIDVWQMEMTGRIITFSVIGVVLMSTAFMRTLNQPKS